MTPYVQYVSSRASYGIVQIIQKWPGTHYNRLRLEMVLFFATIYLQPWSLNQPTMVVKSTSRPNRVLRLLNSKRVPGPSGSSLHM